MEKCSLPFSLDIELKTYHNKSFPLGIIKPNIKNYDIWLCNKLINCILRANGTLDSIDDDIWSAKDGLTFMQHFFIKPSLLGAEGLDLIRYNKSMLREGCYITGGYDEFYIPGKHAYKNFHYNHDYVIFGYNEKNRTFQSAAYMMDETYKFFDISYDDYLDAVIKNDGMKTSVNYYVINSGYEAKINILHIKEKLEDYLFSCHNKNFEPRPEIFGLNAWVAFANNILQLEYKADLRSSRCYMEHHKLMFERIKILTESGHISDLNILNEYYEIYQKSIIVHNLFLKYNLSLNKDVLRRISDIINHTTVIEKEIIERVLKCLKEDNREQT
ncbi:MAG: hypothetical protein E7551_09505 [Ruminococcaceae bacterium]|nr:hypothetical protein [Oscillospiraceae bacterium]